MVDIKDFAVGAQPPLNAAQEKPLIDKIRMYTEILRKAVNAGRVHPEELRMRMEGVMDCLVKIYGKESDLGQFYPAKHLLGKKTPQEYLEVASSFIQRVDAVLVILQNGPPGFANPLQSSGRIFIGHGRSPLWRELKDFIQDRLGHLWDEFNRDAVAGYSTFERLSEMLENAGFAFLIMTAEDEHSDSSLHARENVVHEVGLFQGKLGPRKAIILLEEGCKEFSNIIGLCQIRFPTGRISATFEEIRRVLEREKIRH